MSWKYDLQDFWTQIVLECQATSGSVFMNLCSQVCMYVQSCYFAFIKSEIKNIIMHPRNSKDTHKKINFLNPFFFYITISIYFFICLSLLGLHS